MNVQSLARFFAVVLLLAGLPWAGAAAQGTPLASGTVRAQETGLPLEGIVVRSFYRFVGSGTTVFGETVSGSDGRWSIPMPQQATTVQWISAGGNGYVRLVHPDTVCYRESACPPGNPPSSPVPATNIDFLLVRTSTLTGSVRDAQNEAPIGGATITLYSLSGSIRHEILSDGNGLFARSDIVPGTYHVAAAPFSLTHVTELYPDIDLDMSYPVGQAIADGAPTVTFAPGASTAVPFGLNRPACFSGTLTSPDGFPFANASFFLKRTGPRSSAQFRFVFASVLPQGYSVGGLAPGSVRIRVAPRNDQGDFEPRFYPGASTEEGAVDVPLTAGQCTANINEVLVPRRSVRGSVRDQTSNAPLANALIEIGTQFFGFSPAASTTTNAQGDYVLQGLSANPNYRLRISSHPRYFGEAYSEMSVSSPVSSWTAVPVGDTEHRQGVDFTLTSGAYFSGVVSLPPGAFAGFNVSAVPIGGGERSTFFGGLQGPYVTPAVAPGSFRLVLEKGNFRFGWPGVRCFSVDCNEPGVAAIVVDEVREYSGYDFDFAVLDTMFRSGFE